MPQSRSTLLEPRITVVLQLKPEQAAWIRAHASRRGVSAFMRQLLGQLIEEERRQIAQVRQRLAMAKDKTNAHTQAAAQACQESGQPAAASR